jgi:uncharacterized protein YdaU (DUF1376 family)
MSRFPYHRRYHEDALNGMARLTLEQRGCYQTVLDLIYAHGGPIEDDERYLAAQMLVSIRKWRALRDDLIALGKIWLVDGRIGNGRAERELADSGALRALQAENGRNSAKKRASRAKKTAVSTPEITPENTLKTRDEHPRRQSENVLKICRDIQESELDSMAPMGDTVSERFDDRQVECQPPEPYTRTIINISPSLDMEGLPKIALRSDDTEPRSAARPSRSKAAGQTLRSGRAKPPDPEALARRRLALDAARDAFAGVSREAAP